MRTGDLLDAPSTLSQLGSDGVATAALSMPPLDLSSYSQLVLHMASLYRCDPAAVAASLASITSSASHLPLAVTAPHALSSAALASAALSASQGHGGGCENYVSNNNISEKQQDVKSHSESTSATGNSSNRNVQLQSLGNLANENDCLNRNDNLHSAHVPCQPVTAEKSKKHKHHNTNNVTKNYLIPQNSDGALDLSTQGLRSLYSSYRRIPLDKLKPKIVEDLWVENDSVLSWTNSKVAAYNPAQKLFMCVDCECVGFLSRVAEHWLGAHANLRVFRCPRCPYTSAWSRCVKMHLTRQHNEQCADTTMWKENATLLEVTRLMQELRTKVETRIDSASSLSDKRFYCPHCPYATDRRDLYTRHENIHKDDKPFHCYLCFKQFNRADHVKKHFVRMHPDTHYDISKIRKTPGIRSGRTSPPGNDDSLHLQCPTTKASGISVMTSIGATPTSFPINGGTARQKSVSPLPLTIQNLRVHNMTISNRRPPTPPSPEITVDVVTPDPPQLLSFSPGMDEKPAILSVLEPALPPVHAITITKCSQSSITPSPIALPLTLPNALTAGVPSNQHQPSEPESPESNILFTPESAESCRGSKKRLDRAFRCPYCQWSGSDNWCLKRHMNTHIKPFICTMCEYKAARAERLSTHVLKVHNKRICNKCTFMAITQEKLLEHSREEHHNNPYSRRHTCGICGTACENQASLQSHLQKAHAPHCQLPAGSSRTPSSSASSHFVATSATSEPKHLEVKQEKPEDQAEDLSLNSAGRSSQGEEVPNLVCPVSNCSVQFSDSNTLAVHLEKFHNNHSMSRCPHCSYCLTKDELAKDHWLTHHQEVCAACVHVFTAVYGPRVWKRVHVKPSSQESSLDVIVTGLSRKRCAPSSGNESVWSESEHCESISAESDHHESDSERHCKRSRKQSCPKKVVVAVAADEEGLAASDDSDEDNDEEEGDQVQSDSQNQKFVENKRRKTRRCLRCPSRPLFSTAGRLRLHRRTRHRSTRSASCSAVAQASRKTCASLKALET